MNGKDHHRNPLPATDLEPAPEMRSNEAHENQEDYSRYCVRVISYRKRKHDTDGVSVKAVLDGLVQRGILPDDSCAEIKEVTFESHISKEEKTIIEITRDN